MDQASWAGCGVLGRLWLRGALVIPPGGEEDERDGDTDEDPRFGELEGQKWLAGW